MANSLNSIWPGTRTATTNTTTQYHVDKGVVQPKVTKVAVSAIIRSHGQILIGQRAKDPYREKYTFPGGKIDFLEPLSIALAREVHEETGLSINTLATKQLVTSEWIDPVDEIHYIDVLFEVTDFDGEPKAGSDMASLQFVDAGHLADYNLAPYTYKTISDLIKIGYHF
jgi:ADP-ribose pyrophosphatase YjhB (NUDIX family)